MLRKRKIILIVFFSLFVGFLIFNLPFIYERDIQNYDLSIDSGKIAIISDLHLDSNFRNLNCIGDYLTQAGVDYLIINGDLFDKMHQRELNEELLRGAIERIGIENSGVIKIIYVTAFYNHDPYLERVSRFNVDDLEILALRGTLKLRGTNTNFYILHGDYIIRHLVFLASLADIFLPNLPYEGFARKMLKIKGNDWVILGYSHIPGIDFERKLANAGCWIERILPNSDTMLLIKINKIAEISILKVPCR